MLLAIGAGVVYKVTFAMSAIYRVEVVGLDVFQLVFLGTVLEATVFLFEIPTGVVADVYSRRLSVIIGIAMMVLRCAPLPGDLGHRLDFRQRRTVGLAHG